MATIVGLAAVAVSVGSTRVWAGEAPIRKIVLVTIDTLRADRLSSYGYARPTTPHLDAFAAEGLLFERAMAPAPWTAPSMAAMLTGRYPFETRVYTNQNPLESGMSSLAETLGAAGLATAWFNTNPVLMFGATQFKDGFAHVEPTERIVSKLPYSKIEPAVGAWLEKNAAEDFFVWIHNMDPHSPPTEGNDYLSDKSWHVYDNEIRWVDDAMGRLFDKLKSLGIWEETLVIFTADHGEAFSEHMLPGHQNVIYDEVLQVPLIIRYGGMERTGRTREPVELLDLYRTIAELAHVEVPAGVRGESLVPILAGRAQQRRREYSFHSRYYIDQVKQHHLAVRDRDYKLIAKVAYEGSDDKRQVYQTPQWSLEAPGTTLELYRYSDDPREKKNLIFFGAEPGVADRLVRELVKWFDQMAAGSDEGPHAAVDLDDKTRDTLRRLGYDAK